MNTPSLDATRLRRLQMAALVVQLTILVAGFAMWTRYDFIEARARAQAEVEGTALLLEDHILSSLTAIDGALLQTADLVAEIGLEALGSEAGWRRLRSLARPLPASGAIFVYGPNGATIAASTSFPAPAFNAADRDYFQALIAGGAEQVIGKALRGRTVHGMFFPLARSIKGKDGRIEAVVQIGVEADYISDLFNRAELAWGETVGLYRLTDGAVVVRHPMSEDLLGETVAAQPFFAELAAGGENWSGWTDLAEKHLLVSARRVRGMPLILMASMPHGRVFAPFHAHLRWNGAALLVAIGMLGTLGAMLLASSKREARSRERQQLSEQSLRESEARYRTLFESMTEGFALHEMVTDEEGRPCDYRFLDVNPAFERLTGLKRTDLVGMAAKEALPELEARWIEIYGRVALTGESVHFEDFSRDLDRWYEVFAYCPAPRQFAVVFTDITSKKKADEALCEALTKAEAGDRMLSALMEYVPEGITIADAALNLTRVSRYGQELLGGPHEGMATENVTSRFGVFHPDGETPMAFEDLPLVRAVRRGEVIKDAEIVQNTSRGERLHLLCTAGPILDTEGRVAGGIVAWRDITGLKRVEHELRESTERLRFQRKRMPIGCIVHDEELRFVEVNPAAEHIFGYRAEELIGRRPEVLLPPEARPRVDGILSRLAAGEMTAHSVNENLTRDGRIILCDWLNTPLRDPGGKFIGLLSMVQDVTERNKAEEALRQSEAHFRALAEALPQIVWSSDAEGGVEWFNRRWYEYTGEAQGAGEGWSWDKVSHPEDMARTLENWREALRRGDSYENEIRIRRHDGRYRWFLVHAWPLRSTAGSVVRWVGACTDIHDFKEVERRLEQENREIGLINRILRVFAEATDDELFDRVLEIVQEGLASRHGVFGYIEKPGHLVCPSLSRMLDACEIEGKCIHYPPAKWKGLWARSLIEKRSVCSNKPSPVPAGHPAIRNNLATPILFRGEVIGLLNMANKEGDYTETDKLLLEAMADRIAPLLYAWIQKRLRRIEQDEAREALRDANERYELVLTGSGAAIWDWEVPRHKVMYSQRWKAMRGYGEHEITDSADEWSHGIHPEDAPRVMAALQAHMEGKTAFFDEEYRVRRKDGSWIWIADRGVASRDADGRVVRMAGSEIDITERKRAEAELRAAEELARERLLEIEDIYHNAPVGLCVLDRDLRFVRINERLAEINGFTAAEHIGKTIRDLLPELADTVEPEMRRILETGVPRLNIEIVGETPAQPGFRRSWLEQWLPITDARGRVAALSIVVEETTDRKRAEIALLDSEARFKLLSRTAARLLETDDPLGAVNELAGQVMTHLDCQAFFNFLVDERVGRLHLNAWAGIPDDEARRIEWLDYGVAVCGCVARDGSRIVAENICSVADPRTELVQSYGIEAYACHPLLAGGRVIGTLSFGTRTRSGFSPHDLDLMKTVADQVAVAMERMRLMREIENSRDELETRVAVRTAELAQANTRLQETAMALMGSEEGLRRNNEMLQKIVDGITDPLIMLDGEGRVTMINRAAAGYYGVDESGGIYGKFCFEGLRGRETACPECDHPFLSAGSSTMSFERKGLNDPGTVESVTVYPVLKEHGGRDALIVRISDITLAKILDRQIFQNEKLAALGLVTSGIAHEINNPNSFIYFNIPILRSYLEELMPIVDEHAALHPDFRVLNMSYGELRKDMFRLLENMEHGSRRISKTIDVLKSFVRKRDLEGMQPVDVKQLVGKVVALCQTELRHKVSSHEILVPDDLPPVVSDPEVLEQVLLNLLINAIHASDKPDSHVTLKVEINPRGRDEFIMEITDNGSGIEEGVRERIFDPFFTTKSPDQGTGMGLYICHSHVASLGGRIEVESRVGQGTTFRVVLPQTARAVTDSSRQVEARKV